MLGLFSATAQDKWNEWRDALEQLSQDIQAMPDSPVRDDLQAHADALYHNLMQMITQIGSAAFDRAYCDAMAWIAVKHIQVHHGVVQPEFGNEYSGLAGLGDTQDAPVTIPQQPMVLDYGYVPTPDARYASTGATGNEPPLDNIPSMKKVLCDNGSFIEVVDSMSDADAKRQYCPKAAAPATPGTDWLGIFTGIAKGAGRGAQSYYQIQAQNAALKAQSQQAKVKMPVMTGSGRSSGSSMTPWIIGGLALLVLGGGAAVLAGRKRSSGVKP